MYKSFIGIAFLLFLGHLSFSQNADYQPSTARKFDLLHTTLRLQPDWQKQQMKGEAELLLVPYFYSQQTLVLDAKGFDIEEINCKQDKITYTYDTQKTKISIRFSKEITKQDTLQLTVRYVAKPNELPKGGSDAITSDKGLYFISPNQPNKQLWTQGETQANSCWFPTIDSPNEKHTQTIFLRVENNLTTLSNGKLVEIIPHADGTKTWHWQQNKPHAVYLTMIAAGDFVKTIDPTFTDFEVSYYTEPAHAAYAHAIFGRTPQMIRYFEQLLGVKYPWDKYAQIAVRDYVSGAMENTTATIHGETLLKNHNQLINNNDDGVIAHELFHHWFGNLVTCESWSNLPLNESFADYAEYLWASHFYGENEGDWVALKAMNTYLLEAATKQVPLIRYQYASREDMFDSHSYAKGGRILHMLRRYVGNEAFFKVFQLYLTKNAYKTTEIHDLRLAFEEITGEDLHWFFDQWFFQAGHPRLVATHQFKDGKLRLTITQKQDSTNTFIYRFPLTVLVGNTEHKVWIDAQNHDFLFDAATKPTLVLLDPKGELVGEITHQKEEDELVSQFKETKTIAGRIKALEALTFVPETDETFTVEPLSKPTIRQLVIDATRDDFWAIRQTAVQLLFDYDGEGFLEIEKALQFVIKNDPHAAVRADAILAMKNFLNPQNDILFRNALTDTAYSVRGAALESLLANNPPDAQVLVAQFEDIEDIAIFASVANFYADKADPNRLDWFTTRIQKLSDMEKYQVMGILGTYLVKSNAQTQEKALPFLAELGKNHGQWFVRFAAVQTLILLTDLPKANALISEVMKEETDERLKKIYERYEAQR